VSSLVSFHCERFSSSLPVLGNISMSAFVASWGFFAASLHARLEARTMRQFRSRSPRCFVWMKSPWLSALTP
jgi:hypothetical protein